MTPQLAPDAEAVLLAADPPGESMPALCDALLGASEAIRLLEEGRPSAAGRVLPETFRAAAEAFPLASAESWALFLILARIEQRAGGSPS